MEERRTTLQTPKSDFQPRVVIVGSGPTGLALAIELGSQGIDCLLIERNEREGFAPRAKTTNVRTRELLRRWGIADKLAEASPFGVDYPSDVHFITRLSGRPLVKFPNALNCSPERDERFCEHAQWIPQYKLESVLRQYAETLPAVRLAYGVEFVSFEQSGNNVDVSVRTVRDGSTRTFRAKYLVGADGARSLVRDQIGAKMIGTYGLSRNYNIIFEAPGLAEAHDHGAGSMYWQVNSDTPSLIGRMDTGDLWYFMPTMLPADVKLSSAEAEALIRKATGIDLPYRVLSADEWVASRLLADRYRLGSVFLAGDAAHLHPPFGGFGMNMGFGDGVDLGWKMAAVLNGWGGALLLDSYEIERRPVHEFVMAEAESNHGVLANQLFREGIEADTLEGAAIRGEVAGLIQRTKAQEFYTLGVILGYRYEGSPIIRDDGSDEVWSKSRDYVPTAVPGALAPHAWLSETQSLYDLFGSEFTLLAFADTDGSDLSVAEDEAFETGIPLRIVRLADPRLAALFKASRALIRPDQHIAWRGAIWPDAGLLAQVAGWSPLSHERSEPYALSR